MKTKMPNSIRKHIRTEKARIRRDVFSVKEQKDKINKLYQGSNIKRKKLVKEDKSSFPSSPALQAR